MPSFANRCSSFLSPSISLPGLSSAQIVSKLSVHTHIPSTFVTHEKFNSTLLKKMSLFSTFPKIDVVHNIEDKIFTLSYEEHDTAYLKYR